MKELIERLQSIGRSERDRNTFGRYIKACREAATALESQARRIAEHDAAWAKLIPDGCEFYTFELMVAALKDLRSARIAGMEEAAKRAEHIASMYGSGGLEDMCGGALGAAYAIRQAAKSRAVEPSPILTTQDTSEGEKPAHGAHTGQGEAQE